MTKHSQETIRQVIAAYEKAGSYRAAAGSTGVPFSSVYRIVRKGKTSSSAPDDAGSGSPLLAKFTELLEKKIDLCMAKDDPDKGVSELREIAAAVKIALDYDKAKSDARPGPADTLPEVRVLFSEEAGQFSG